MWVYWLVTFFKLPWVFGGSPYRMRCITAMRIMGDCGSVTFSLSSCSRFQVLCETEVAQTHPDPVCIWLVHLYNIQIQYIGGFHIGRFHIQPDQNPGRLEPVGDKRGNRGLLDFHVRGSYHVWPSQWPPGRLFSSANQWFSSAMLVFQGVSSLDMQDQTEVFYLDGSPAGFRRWCIHMFDI